MDPWYVDSKDRGSSTHLPPSSPLGWAEQCRVLCRYLVDAWHVREEKVLNDLKDFRGCDLDFENEWMMVGDQGAVAAVVYQAPK